MKVLSTDGLTKLIQLIKSAFISVDDTVTTTTVELADVATSGSYNDLSDKPTIPAAQVNSDWNATSGKAEILNKPNLATVATSGSYNDLTNKPTIPTVNNATLTIQQNGTDVQTFSANASSNVTANITVPTSISDLTDDTSTTPIDKADTLTGLTASVTELNYVDGVTSSIQTQIDGKADTTLSNVASIDANSAVQTALDGKVSKSGDTMTDNLTISKDGVTPKLILTNTSFDPTSTTAPEANQYCGALEWHGEDDYLTGFVRNRHSTSNNFQTQIGIKRKVNGSDIEAVLNVGINASGDAVCSFPKSYNVDGQWVYNSVVVANTVTFNNAHGTKTYSLSNYLPNDNYNYEVLITGTCDTGTTSSNFVNLYVGIDNTKTEVISRVCVARTRSASMMQAAGGALIAIPSNMRQLVVYGNSSSNANGTYSLWVTGYRRIGTNS